MSEIVVVITGATGPSGSGSAALNDLTDVTITSATNGQVLKYNGSAWVNGTDSTGSGSGTLDDLTDVTITAAASGDILRHNGTAWVDAVGTTHFEAAGAVAAHEADTTNVHGITDTSALYRSGGTDVAVADGGTGASDAATARTNLGLAIGTNVQAYDAELAAIAGLTSAADQVPYFTGSGTAALMTVTSTARAVLDDVNTAAMRSTLGLIIGTDVAAQSSLASYLPLVAAGASVENIGAVEANVNTVATTGATETLDTSLYQVHDCTMDQNCTFTFSNPAPSGKCSSFVLILRGAFTPTLPAAVDWSTGAAPTYTTPSMYTFTTVDAGTTWLGAQVGRAFA